ncbi:MAG: hypothetical protein U5J97_08310 [Trueperaceae bacterium]|nr:hypothetical protein [Trueperaceae bacterium]
MVHAAGSRSGGTDLRGDLELQLRMRAAVAHGEHTHLASVVVEAAVVAHAQHALQQRLGRGRIPDGGADRSQSPDLVGDRNVGAVPRHRSIAGPAVVDEGQSLSLGVLERQRPASVALGGRLGRHAVLP